MLRQIVWQLLGGFRGDVCGNVIFWVQIFVWDNLFLSVQNIWERGWGYYCVFGFSKVFVVIFIMGLKVGFQGDLIFFYVLLQIFINDFYCLSLWVLFRDKMVGNLSINFLSVYFFLCFVGFWFKVVLE